MIPAILLKGVDPVLGARLVTSGQPDAARLLPQLDPGDIVSARVEAKLPDGSYKVLVAGQAMRMALPSFLAPGDTLDLTLVAREPRLTFELRNALPLAPGVAPSLSVAGRLVAATMLRTGELPTPASASVAGPLLAAPPADGARLSAELAQTVTASGLFYESHLAEWVAGTRDLSQILQEPQARLLSSEQRDQQSMQPQAALLVQQQLAALDKSNVMMQVEIWPKQWMQWSIEEHQTSAENSSDPQPDWATQLRLELPQLGKLNALLNFGVNGISIRIEAINAASAALLQDQRSSLQEALATAGLPAARIAIKRYEPT
jgi:hypothetical protein